MNAFLKTCRALILAVSVAVAGSEVARAQEAKRADILIADFEAETYGDWKVEGEAFGSGPAEGTLAGKSALLQIVDQHQGGWGHINVDHIVQSDKHSVPPLVELAKTLKVDSTHLIMPVSNNAKVRLLGIYDGEKLVQNFNVALPQGNDPFWLAAYPLTHFGLAGREITLAPVESKKLPEAYRPR